MMMIMSLLPIIYLKVRSYPYYKYTTLQQHREISQMMFQQKNTRSKLF